MVKEGPDSSFFLGKGELTEKGGLNGSRKAVNPLFFSFLLSVSGLMNGKFILKVISSYHKKFNFRYFNIQENALLQSPGKSQV